MLFSELKNAIAKNTLLVLLTISIVITVVAAGFSVATHYENKKLEAKLSACTTESKRKTKELQQIAIAAETNFVERKEVQEAKQEERKDAIIEAISQSEEIHLRDCTDANTLQLLQQVYAARATE